MKKEIVSTDKAPAAVGPYSQGVKVGDLLFTAGQIALDPATMKLVGDDVTAQTERVLKNLGAVLENAGTSFANVVKTTVFLNDMADFAAMNAVYATFFGEAKPARSTVAVEKLPLEALVEIEAVALLG